MTNHSTLIHMKKTIVSLALALAAHGTLSAQEVKTKLADGTVVINTTTLAKDVKGYDGATPVNVFIKDGKVLKVEALDNQEGPKYMHMVRKNLLASWNGLKTEKALTLKVDAVTGATYTSNAVIENVKRGLQYYKKHK